MLTNESDIARKIRALQALANRAGTEAEAALAADKIAELLKKHNLSIGACALEAEEKNASESQFTHDTARDQRHRSYLRLACCNMFNVGVYRRASYGRLNVTFYGLKANAEAAAITYPYLLASVDALMDGYARSHYCRGTQARNDFKMGAAKRIYEMGRAMKAARQVQDVSAESMALVTLENNLVKAHRASMKGLHSTRINVRLNSYYAAGYAAGARVDIHGARRSRMLN